MNPTARQQAQRNERTFRFLSYGFVFLMMACVALTFSILVDHILPEWNAVIIAGAAIFVIVDRLYTYRYVKALTPFSSEWAIALFAQWLVIALVIRLLLWYAGGLDAFRQQLSLFVRGYMEQLFTAEFIMTVLLALLIWYLTGQFLNLIDEIGVEQSIAMSEDSAAVQQEAVPAHKRMVNLVFSLGVVLVILTAMTRMSLASAAPARGLLPRVEFSRFSGAEAGALLYFIFALGLLSLCRLMSLQTHWNRLHIPVSSQNLARQWGRYSLAFLLILALLVSILPSGDSIGFFTVLGTLLSFLVGILLFIGQLIIFLAILLISVPFVLFGITTPGSSVPREPPPLPILPTQPIIPTESSELLNLIRSILLWGSLAVIVVFFLLQFLRQHGSILSTLRRSRIAAWMQLAWQWLFTNVNRTGANLSRVISDGWQNIRSRMEGKPVLPPIRFPGFRSLDPRRRIYFYYLAMVRRGDEKGVGRTPSQTPSEYAATLERALPSAGEDIDSITQAFVEARYSRREIGPETSERVKEIWGRVRRALQELSSRAKPKDRS